MIRSSPLLLFFLVYWACAPNVRSTSDADGIGFLSPGGDPPGALNVLLFQARGTQIGFPSNWIVTIESDADARYGPIQVVTARGPRETGSGVGYSAILWFSVPTAANGGVLNGLVDFQTQRNQDYLDRDGSLSASTPATVGGRNASQTVIDGRKRVPAHALNRQEVPTRVSSSVVEANGFFHDIALTGSVSDHDRLLSVYQQVLDSVQFVAPTP